MADSKRIILLAVDGSQQAQDACDFYLNNLHKSGNVVVLAHVVDLPDMAHARQVYMTPVALAECWKEEGAKADVLERKFQNYLIEHGVETVKSRTGGGLKPGQVICDMANEEKATMVVMGTRGMGKIRRTLLGSVSDYVIHHATCPVVICRKYCPETDSEETDS